MWNWKGAVELNHAGNHGAHPLNEPNPATTIGSEPELQFAAGVSDQSVTVDVTLSSVEPGSSIPKLKVWPVEAGCTIEVSESDADGPGTKAKIRVTIPASPVDCETECH